MLALSHVYLNPVKYLLRLLSDRGWLGTGTYAGVYAKPSTLEDLQKKKTMGGRTGKSYVLEV
jgi:hypothetical protein